MPSSGFAFRLAGRVLTPEFERRTWLWAGFVAFYFFLLGFPRLFTIVSATLVLMGAFRAVLLWRNRRAASIPAAYLHYFILFLLLWLPLFFSLPDASYQAEAAAGTFRILAYGLLGFAMIWLVRERSILQPLTILMTALALFWTADVIFQRVVGFDVFGRIYTGEGEARAGAYFKNAAKFGTYLACMDILALFYIAPRLGSPWRLLALWCFLLVGMVFSMSRTGWVIFMMFSSPLLLVHFQQRYRYAWLGVLLVPAILAPLAYSLYLHDPVLQARMARTLAFTDGMTYENWNTVLTYRLDLWRASLQMFAAHWFNGSGLEAFTTDFHHYPAAPFWQTEQPSHEHHYILQVMVATGSLGLLGLLGLHVWLAVLFFRYRRNASLVLPLAMYLLSMWFPVGSHFSFYSSEWVWANLMLLAVLVAGLEYEPATATKPSG